MMMKIPGFRKIVCAAPLLVAFCCATNIVEGATEFGTKSPKADLHVVVKPGDTVTSIINREMGSLDHWAELVDYNKMLSPNTLVPGEIIVIPWELLKLRNFAKIVFVKGDVTLQRSGTVELLAVAKGDKIYIGDSIQTGKDGFVSLTFKGDSLVNVQPESHLLLNELECFDVEQACQIDINTTSGQMKLNIDNSGFARPTKFTIDTPYASAAVRGTVFDFMTDDGNILGVTEGSVEIFADDQSSTVPVGKGTLAGEGQSVSVLYDLLPKPLFNEFRRISAEDTISWNPVEGAVVYNVVIADSESMTDVVQSVTVQGIVVSALPERGASRYYISTRAVAENGLKGFTSTRPIDPVSIDEEVSAPEMKIELVENTLTIKPDSEFDTEIHIGGSLHEINGLGTLVDYVSYDVTAGETLSVEVDSSKAIYLVSRALIDKSTVSSYGGLYRFGKVGK